MSPPVQNPLAQTFTKEELALLARLSPHGVAKLNRDLLGGVPFAQVLNDLKKVYKLASDRCQTLKEQLSDAAKEMLVKLGRPHTQQELTLFASVPMETIENAVSQLQKAGYSFDLAIEELALVFQYQQLDADAREVHKYYELPIQVSQLVSTLCPTSLNVSSRNVIKVNPNRIIVSLSPIMLWFNLDGDVHINEDVEEKTKAEQTNRIEKSNPFFMVGLETLASQKVAKKRAVHFASPAAQAADSSTC